MSTFPILSGLREIAEDYDALICDIWGVLHDGRQPFLDAAEALRAFRARGPVVLLSNAPRPIEDIHAQFRHIGVPLDMFDGVVTSGVATREALAARSAVRRLSMLHIGPERDRGVFEGLNLDVVEADAADIVLCTGLWDDDTETPEDYSPLLEKLKARDLELLCANPDLVVQRGGELVYCAGAIAQAYEAMGGRAIYYGKPYLPVYEATMARLKSLTGKDVLRVLAIGDGIGTDIKGANAAGIEALFIAQGIHGAELAHADGLQAEKLEQLLASAGAQARAGMASLVW